MSLREGGNRGLLLSIGIILPFGGVVMQTLHVDPHCLYLDDRGRMDGARVLLQREALIQASEVPWDVKQRQEMFSFGK